MAAWEEAPLVEAETASQPQWMSAPLVAEGGDAPPSAPAQPAPEGPGYVNSFVTGLGHGIGKVAIGAEHGIGKLVNGFGHFKNAAGDYLLNDAAQAQQQNDAGFAPAEQAHPIVAGAGNLGGEMVATLPVGGVLGKGVQLVARAVPAASSVLAPVADAIASAGMRSGGVDGIAGLAAKTVGGAVNGGATTALVDPSSAGEGALVGAVLPGTLKGLGEGGALIAKILRGPDVPESIRATAQAARAAGYVIPPTQVRPSFVNRVLEGTAGKLSTAQAASMRNQAVTNQLALRALGLDTSTDLTDGAINAVRRQAGESYQTLRNLGQVQADDAFQQALGNIEATQRGAGRSFPGLVNNGVSDLVESLRMPAFDSGDAVDAISLLRDNSGKAYRAGDNTVGRANRQAAEALEGVLERTLEANGDPKALDAFRQARQLYAKTFTVEKALNPTTGTINAQKLASELQKGRPLSGELRQIAEFAQAFPKAAQPIERMGSLPGVSPLDVASTVGVSAATQNPLAALLLFGRPLARSAALSAPIQNGLATIPAAQATHSLLNSPPYRDAIAALFARAAPLLSTSP